MDFTTIKKAVAYINKRFLEADEPMWLEFRLELTLKQSDGKNYKIFETQVRAEWHEIDDEYDFDNVDYSLQFIYLPEQLMPRETKYEGLSFDRMYHVVSEFIPDLEPGITDQQISSIVWEYDQDQSFAPDEMAIIGNRVVRACELDPNMGLIDVVRFEPTDTD